MEIEIEKLIAKAKRIYVPGIFIKNVSNKCPEQFDREGNDDTLHIIPNTSGNNEIYRFTHENYKRNQIALSIRKLSSLIYFDGRWADIYDQFGNLVEIIPDEKRDIDLIREFLWK